MKVVVVTGSTRGLGFALAQEFLARECAVVVCGRTQAAVDKATTALAAHAPAERIFGMPCDVGDFAQVEALWQGAVEHFGRVDIWINNAGLGGKMRDFWAQSADEMESIVQANVVGSMYGCRVALAGMLAQGSGALYNMEGFGSDGSVRPGLTPYATSKAAIRYLTKALVRETKGTPVQVGAISPGLMVTDLLMENVSPDQKDSARKVFNILADRVETVAPWIVERVLANNKSGVRIEWLTRAKVLRRFTVAPFQRRQVID
jgi:NAD(P)-dependent dehydrogenase (short-subunit alcohol dehydrogenase family)